MKYGKCFIFTIALLLLLPLAFAATVIIPESSEPKQYTAPGTFVIQHSDINTKGLATNTLTIPGKSDTAAILELLRQRKAARDAAGYNSIGFTDITYANPMPENQDTVGYGNGDYYWPTNYGNYGYGNNNGNYPGTYESCDVEYYGSPYYVSGLGFPFSFSFSSLFSGYQNGGYGCNRYNGNNSYYPGYYGNGGYGRDWYYFANGTYTLCDTQDEFVQRDCSYRFDGRRYYYDNAALQNFYNDPQYDPNKIDISDRFALINGRYVLCPQRAYDHDECVFYYKSGKWYYDDPSDNDFTGIPNIEINSDLDRPANSTNTTNNDTQNNTTNNTNNQNNNTYNPGNILPPGYFNYRAYVDQFPKYNYVNSQFVSCTSSCSYYKRDNVMFLIDQVRYAQG